MRTLFLQAPSFDGYDGGAGARYQMKREVRSFWYPTWLAQPAALVEGSKLIDAPPSTQSMVTAASASSSADVGAVMRWMRKFAGVACGVVEAGIVRFLRTIQKTIQKVDGGRLAITTA